MIGTVYVLFCSTEEELRLRSSNLKVPWYFYCSSVYVLHRYRGERWMVSSVIRVYSLKLYFRGGLAYPMSGRSLLYCQWNVITERSLFDGVITSLLDMTTSLLQFHALYSYLVRNYDTMGWSKHQCLLSPDYGLWQSNSIAIYNEVRLSIRLRSSF